MARPRSKRPLTVAITASAGRWVAFVPVGDGKPRRKRSATMCAACKVEPRAGCACWEACADKVRELEDQVTAGAAGTAGRKPTVEAWFTTWLTDIAPHQPGGGSRRKPLAVRTLDDYWSRCNNWIFPKVGPKLVDQLSADDLDTLYGAMYADGRASAHVLKTHAVIRRGLSVAMQRGKVTRNVAAMMDNPGSPSAHRKAAMSLEQAEAFVAMLDGLPDGLRWKVHLAIGPRQGEVLAIRWAYVDLVAGTVDTAWQIQRRTWRHGCGGSCGRKRAAECPSGSLDVRAGEELVRASAALVFCRPKTWNEGDAGHVVKLPEPLVKELREHRKRQLEARLAAGNRWEEHDLVFCQPNGRPIDPRRDYGRCVELLGKAGLADAGTHVLRHSAATLMLELGVDIAVVQEVLGHTDIRITRGYQRVSVGLTARAATAMGEGLFGTSSATTLATARSRRRRREA